MSVGALKRATDDHVGALSCDLREILVKIEIVAGQKCKAYALKLENIRLGVFIAVVNVKSVTAISVALDLAGRRMSLEILADDLALAVDRVGRVAHALAAVTACIDEKQRVASLSGRARLLQKERIVFLDRTIKASLALDIGKRVAVLGKQDQIHTLAALIKLIQKSLYASVKLALIKGISRLYHTYFHSLSHQSASILLLTASFILHFSSNTRSLSSSLRNSA